MKIPIEGLCPVCTSAFDYLPRKQGGGKRRIYCSARCRSLDWVRGNGGKRQATVIKYDNKPENKAAKAHRERLRRFERYGLSERLFEAMLARQAYRCCGCLGAISKETAQVDHDHATEIVRGLLCKSCNWGLGHLKDDSAVLRRLMAYMARDRTKTSIYLVGSLRNEQVPVLGQSLRDEGYDVWDEWFSAGPEADDYWQKYEKARGRSYVEALRSRAAQNTFLFDKVHLELADGIVLLHPAGKSAHLELGYAIGMGKPTFILSEPHADYRFEVMPNFAAVIVDSVENLKTALALQFC